MRENAVVAKFSDKLKKLQKAGAPIHFRKTHGSMFSRNTSDMVLCVGGRYVTIEWKRPDEPATPSAAQSVEMSKVKRAGGSVYCCNTVEAGMAAVFGELVLAGWTTTV